MTVTLENVRTLVPATHLRDALSAALLSAGKDVFLPILAAVQVEKCGGELIFRATDRYRLTRVTITLNSEDAPSPDWMVTLSAADVKQLVNALPKPKKGQAPAPVALTVEDGILHADTGQAELRLKPLDGDFPKVDGIIPTEINPVDEIGFNPKYLADLGKMPGFDGNQSVKLRFNGPKAMRAEWGSDDVQFVYLLMPVRLNG
ncbi:hypothetical protein [Kribbella italica]|uniref:DNA polymerase III sliding clamp (Beta) subunit (PCNA family) n=1 Tax=Kribbella italica TaxID=1540520 RepID=A0A7W9MRW2_9ACTN|nr:hypothetical protein [Kribbella italica]MBB5833430.1 DNA polymerase III sliding clamp (beta) subunit (PCNA family) [Kribbella italica]